MLKKDELLSIRERVFLQLRNSILNGDFECGEKLNEKELSDKFSVSRTPVREALHKLEQEGLVEIAPRRYCKVIGITKETIHEINVIRSHLEPVVSKDAVKNIDEEELGYMRKMLEETEIGFKENDINKVMYSNDEFHNTLIKSSENYKRIIKLLEDYHGYIVIFRQSFMSRKELVERSIKEHRQIFEAVAQKDEDRVELLTKKHLEGIIEYEDVVLADMQK